MPLSSSILVFPPLQIFGCVLCGVGAYALQSKAGSLAGETLPQGIIVIGVFIILISFLGCLAAFKESRFFLAIVRTRGTATTHAGCDAMQ